jgi:hypothetical protein
MALGPTPVHVALGSLCGRPSSDACTGIRCSYVLRTGLTCSTGTVLKARRRARKISSTIGPSLVLTVPTVRRALFDYRPAIGIDGAYGPNQANIGALTTKLHAGVQISPCAVPLVVALAHGTPGQ